EQGTRCQQQKQTFISCHFLLKGKSSESWPGSVKVARSAPKGNLDGWPRFATFEWEGMASSLVVHHDSVLLPNFHPRSDRLLRRTHVGIRSDRVGAAYWIAVLFSDPFSCRSRRGKCIAQPGEGTACLSNYSSGHCSSGHCWF